MGTFFKQIRTRLTRIPRAVRDTLEGLQLLIQRRAEPHIRRILKTVALFTFVVGAVNSEIAATIVKTLGLSDYVTIFVQDLLIVVGIMVAFQLLRAILDIVLHKQQRMPASPKETLEFTARPYLPIGAPARATDMLHVATLTPAAEEEFAGDTMRAEVVQAAVRNGCAIGLKVSDKTGADIGFFDLYHLKDDSLATWVQGTVFEKSLTPQDFEAIADVKSRGDKRLDLIVGAILMKHKNPIYNYYLAPLLSAAAQRYLAHAARDFSEVRMFASIYSDAGGRFAEIFGFSPFLERAKRGAAGKTHDVYCRTFIPGGLEATYFAQSRDNVYVLSLKDV